MVCLIAFIGSESINLTETADPEATGAGPCFDPPKLGALVGGVAGPIGSGASRGTSLVFEGHDREERQN